ncbi:MAG TPA: hypothetical protein VNW90_04740 [Acetobacteraceae bacterium]|nr:hypothetical protein [Acetobacteraceae bacterium]
MPDSAGRAAEIEELSRRAAVYATRARGDGTRRTCRSAWHSFEAWCRSLGREPPAADPDTQRTTKNVGAIKNLHSSADLTARAAVSASGSSSIGIGVKQASSACAPQSRCGASPDGDC